MTPKEITEVTDRMVGLFIDMTPEKTVFWTKEFQKCEYSVDVANAAIDKAAAEGRYADPQRIFAVLNTFRRQEAERREQKRMERLRGEELQMAKDREKISKLLNALSDSELAELKAEVLAMQPAGVREVRKNLNPRTAIGLQADIYAHVMKSEQAVARDPTEPRRVSAPILSGIDL